MFTSTVLAHHQIEQGALRGMGKILILCPVLIHALSNVVVSDRPPSALAVINFFPITLRCPSILEINAWLKWLPHELRVSWTSAPQGKRPSCCKEFLSYLFLHPWSDRARSKRLFLEITRNPVLEDSLVFYSSDSLFPAWEKGNNLTYPLSLVRPITIYVTVSFGT